MSEFDYSIIVYVPVFSSKKGIEIRPKKQAPSAVPAAEVAVWFPYPNRGWHLGKVTAINAPDEEPEHDRRVQGR